MKNFLWLPMMFLAIALKATGIHVGPGQTYKTIYAVTSIHAAHPGDTIYMHAGVYSDAGQVFDSLIGTPTQWITIRPVSYTHLTLPTNREV